MDSELLLSHRALQVRLSEIGEAISREHPRGVICIGMLKGAVIVLADLLRHLSCPVAVDFMAISRFRPDSGRVRIVKDVELEIAGRDVLVVEDVVDTGLTFEYVRSYLDDRGPQSLKLFTMLDRPDRRIVPVHADYAALEISGDSFVIGAGLHVGEVYRNLSSVYRVDRLGIQTHPFALVESLYGSG